MTFGKNFSQKLDAVQLPENLQLLSSEPMGWTGWRLPPGLMGFNGAQYVLMGIDGDWWEFKPLVSVSWGLTCLTHWYRLVQIYKVPKCKKSVVILHSTKLYGVKNMNMSILTTKNLPNYFSDDKIWQICHSETIRNSQDLAGFTAAWKPATYPHPEKPHR